MRTRTPFGLTGEEALGLFVAIAAHVALIVALVLSPLGRKVQPPPQRMTVSLSDTVADQATSPKPDAQAAPDLAPELGEPDHADQPLPPAPQPVATPEPRPVPKPAPRPEPKPEPKPVPRPVAKPEPKPEPKPVAKPQPKPKPVAKVEHKVEPKVEAKAASKARPDAKAKPEAKPEVRPEARPAGGDPRAHPHPAKPAGGSKIDSNFLTGLPGSTTPGTDKVSPGNKVATVSAADVRSAISRQLKPHWTAPQGADAEKLVTIIAFTLNSDGTLAGTPELYAQSGVTDANRPQAQRHVELAIRAVKLAAPFKLPADVYSHFHKFTAKFDRQLSQ